MIWVLAQKRCQICFRAIMPVDAFYDSFGSLDIGNIVDKDLISAFNGSSEPTWSSNSNGSIDFLIDDDTHYAFSSFEFVHQDFRVVKYATASAAFIITMCYQSTNPKAFFLFIRISSSKKSIWEFLMLPSLMHSIRYLFLYHSKVLFKLFFVVHELLKSF